MRTTKVHRRLFLPAEVSATSYPFMDVYFCLWICGIVLVDLIRTEIINTKSDIWECMVSKSIDHPDKMGQMLVPNKCVWQFLGDSVKTWTDTK